MATLLLLASAIVWGEDHSPDTSRPTHGLVLEGGGALGLAHIGVITWLEEHHIPIDYVTGTSMGGLVGGLYATGHSPAEMRQIINEINWDKVLSGQTPFQDLSFRRKQDAHDYPNSLEFGIRNGLRFPEGFNSGQQVSLILDQIALPYSEIKSFNDLPIPFACVATNLVSGQPKVFRDGSLSLALRSTMSLPGIFTPVRQKDEVYADGGLLNNLPINVARQMGANLVLGVHLEVAPLNPEAPMSSFTVLGRSISVMIAANELRSMEQADLLISVPLAKYTSTDYNKADEIIKAGYDAAAAKANILLTLSVDEATWAQYIAARNARRRTNPVPTFVTVDGVSGYLSRQIEKEMADVLNKPIDYDELDQKIMQLKGLGRFSNLSYKFVDKDGQQGLDVQTEENVYGPPFVLPLILVDGSNYQNVLFNLGARITMLDVGGFRSELRTDVILFSEYGVRTEYYHPLTPLSHWFVAPRALVDSDPFYIYSDNNLAAVYRKRTSGGGLDLGYEFGRTGELRFGYEGGYERFSTEIGNRSELPTFSGTYGDTRVQYTLDRLDDPVIPRQGQFVQADWEWVNTSPIAPAPYPLVEAKAQDFFRISEPSSIFLSGYVGSAFDYQTGLPQFSLGGSTELVAYGINELLANQYLLFQVGYLRQFAKLPPLLGGGIYGLGLYEVAQVYDQPLGVERASGLPTDAAAGLVVNTIFGPVEAAYAYGDTGHHKFFFRIGRLF
jgi:NTE family protein